MSTSLVKKSHLIYCVIIFLSVTACKKETSSPREHEQQSPTTASNEQSNGHLKQAKTFTSEVAVKWMDMQLRQIKANPTVMANVAFCRAYAYCGIALYESIVDGMPSYQSVASQLNGLSGLPKTMPGLAYNWAVAANAALAYMNKGFFPLATTANKAAMDSLEQALNASYNIDADAAVISRSTEFGKAIAKKVFDWAETDGYLQINDAYTPLPALTGPAFWVPPPTPSIQSAPYWGNVRRLVPGSGASAQAGPPPAYSTDPGSEFYKMVKEVYDLSPLPGSEQQSMALFWRDVPGTSTPGHYVSILKQVLESDKPSLDVAALAYALGGIMVFDASISTWQTKYTYNLVRPITYVRNVLGHTTWSPFLGTPPHPEYPSGHASLSAANAEALTIVFGNDHSFVDHTFDYLGFASRSYNSFRDAGEEAGISRLYAGIHYRISIDVGLWQGRKVAGNILGSLKFSK